MNEQEYQDKLKVRTQLSLMDQFRVLEHEFGVLQSKFEGMQKQVDVIAQQNEDLQSKMKNQEPTQE